MYNKKSLYFQDLNTFYEKAFVTPEGKKGLIVLNETIERKTFSIQFKNNSTTIDQDGAAVCRISVVKLSFHFI